MALAQWLRLRFQPGHGSVLYQPAPDVKCEDCGLHFPRRETFDSHCGKCEGEIRVCKMHKPPPQCLKCSHTEVCAVCLDVRKPAYLQDAFCATCDREIRVCDDHLAEPMCHECIG